MLAKLKTYALVGIDAVPVEVELSTVSDQMRRFGIDRIALLKIDVERSELNVLKGIREDDWGRIDRIIAEVHDTHGRLDAIVALLTAKSCGGKRSDRSSSSPPWMATCWWSRWSTGA